MMNKVLLLIISSLYTISSLAQSHWESLVREENTWSYWEANSEPTTAWNTLGFDDSSWKQGPGGIGYSDGDDATTVKQVFSLYLRKEFQIIDLAEIESLLLDIDYDDGFVAYINGTEIARSSNIDVDQPSYNSGTSIDREALMYSGGEAARYTLDQSLLGPGTNLLAVHILNYNATSSDLSARVFLNALIQSDATRYQTVPTWFKAPVVLQGSRLPIIKITTQGQTIQDDPKISAHMGIINNGVGELNHLTDTFSDYDGHIGIELRGQSSLYLFPKKSYGFETRDEMGENLNVNLLGMPKENDWILYAPYSDKSLMRNVLTFEMAKAMDMYSSRTVYCELYVNNQYEGIYVLMEKIKRDDSRVDVDSLLYTPGDDDSNTGGYIFKVDKIDVDYSAGYTGWTTYPKPSFPNAMDITYQYVYPKPKNIESYQAEYLKDVVTLAEERLIANDFADKELGYNKYLNIGSFVDFMLINEVSKEVDKYRYSTYFHKKKDSKGGEIYAGPIWDFNLGYGNVDYWDYGNATQGWLYTDVKNLSYSIIYWWMRLMQDPFFAQVATQRYQALRSDQWSNDNINHTMDSISKHLFYAQERNFERWPIMGTYVWPNKIWQNMTYENEVTNLNIWIINRLEWMDANLSSSPLVPEIEVSTIDNTTLQLELSDLYFNHSVLKNKYFSIKGDNGAIGIDSVKYINAQKALVYYETIADNTLNTAVALEVDDNIITAYTDLRSNTFSLSLAIDQNTINTSYKIYTQGRNIIVSNTEGSASECIVELIDMSGKVVVSQSTEPRGGVIFNKTQTPGIYIVSCRADNAVFRQKVIVR